MQKNYGELMALLLKSRMRHGGESGFRAYIVESVRTLALDLRELGLDVSINHTVSEPPAMRREAPQLKIGCE